MSKARSSHWRTSRPMAPATRRGYRRRLLSLIGATGGLHPCPRAGCMAATTTSSATGDGAKEDSLSGTFRARLGIGKMAISPDEKQTDGKPAPPVRIRIRPGRAYLDAWRHAMTARTAKNPPTPSQCGWKHTLPAVLADPAKTQISLKKFL
jgi:hypothetical protein